MEYYSRKDVQDIIRKLTKEPRYQHDGEDFYCGVEAVASEIACLDKHIFDKSTTTHQMPREQEMVMEDKMTWVYIVVSKDSDSILNVFSSRPKALEYIDTLDSSYLYDIVARPLR
jgi:hypothetical protein